MCMHDTQTDHDRKSGNAAKKPKTAPFRAAKETLLNGKHTKMKQKKIENHNIFGARI